MSHDQMAQALRQARLSGRAEVFLATAALRIPRTRTPAGYITKGASVRVLPNGEVYWAANSGKHFTTFVQARDFDILVREEGA